MIRWILTNVFRYPYNAQKVINLPEPMAYVWTETWKDEDTQYGSGDYNDQTVFDTEPPLDGVKYSKLYTEEQVRELLNAN